MSGMHHIRIIKMLTCSCCECPQAPPMAGPYTKRGTSHISNVCLYVLYFCVCSAELPAGEILQVAYGYSHTIYTDCMKESPIVSCLFVKVIFFSLGWFDHNPDPNFSFGCVRPAIGTYTSTSASTYAMQVLSEFQFSIANGSFLGLVCYTDTNSVPRARNNVPNEGLGSWLMVIQCNGSWGWPDPEDWTVSGRKVAKTFIGRLELKWGDNRGHKLRPPWLLPKNNGSSFCLWYQPHSPQGPLRAQQRPLFRCLLYQKGLRKSNTTSYVHHGPPQLQPQKRKQKWGLPWPVWEGFRDHD